MAANPPLNTLFTLLGAPAFSKVCPGPVPSEFQARLVRYNGDKIDRLTIGDEGTALAAKKAIVEAGDGEAVGRDAPAPAPRRDNTPAS